MMLLIGNRCRRMRRNKIRNGLRTRACRYIDGNKIIPYYVISTLVRSPRFSPRLLLSSRLRLRRVWRQQSEKLRRDTDWLRLQPLSRAIFLLFFILAHASRSPRESTPGRAWMLEKIFPRTPHPSRRRENPTPHSPDFCTFFQDARPSPPDWPTLSLSDLDVRRAYGLSDHEIFHRLILSPVHVIFIPPFLRWLLFQRASVSR